MTIKKNVSPIIEEYLQTIYSLEKEHGLARTKLLANMVGVSLGTVTNTIDAFKHENLVTHEPYNGVKLTQIGRKIALDVIRRHRLSERLLTDFLKIDWSKVHEHACKLEHAITNDLVNSMEEALGYPETCPHGNPIPTLSGEILEEQLTSLENLNREEKSVVMKIVNEGQDLLEYLMAVNLVPGSRIEVVKKVPFDGPITLKIDGQSRSISRHVASIVWVKTARVNNLWSYL